MPLYARTCFELLTSSSVKHHTPGQRPMLPWASSRWGLIVTLSTKPLMGASSLALSIKPLIRA
eukprot:1158308-Pelagomonas_calceolata.AAC.11